MREGALLKDLSNSSRSRLPNAATWRKMTEDKDLKSILGELNGKLKKCRLKYNR